MKATQNTVDAVLNIDRLVHEPARLAILTVLANAQWAEFGFLETICHLSKGNLSSHLSKLETAGMIQIDKRFEGKKPVTRAAITTSGRNALERYRAQIAVFCKGIPKP